MAAAMHLLILLVLSALVTLSSGSWIECAAENAECSLGGDNRDKQFWVKFMPEDLTLPVLYRQAINYAHCSSAFFGGDPAPGKKKRCWRMQTEGLVAPSLLHWTWPGEGADYGQTMNQSLRFGDYPAPGHSIVWQAGSTMMVRPGIHLLEMGIKGSWSVYGFVGDPKVWTEVMCGQNFGVRPGEAHQHCRISDNPISLLAEANATWRVCGAHGKNCVLNSNNVWAPMGFIVRYGRGSAWSYQIVTSGSGQLDVNLKCDPTTFRGVTAHSENQCFFTPLPFQAFNNNVGEWSLVQASCVPSNGEGNAEFSFEHGMLRTLSTAQSHTYTETVAESVAMLLGMKDVKSVTFTASFSQALALMTMTTDTWTENSIQTSKSSMDLGAAGRCAFIWSWIMSTTEMGGIGDPTASVAKTLYVEGTYSANNPPPCPPSMKMPKDCTWENCLKGGWDEDKYYAGGCNATYHRCGMDLCVEDYGTAPPTIYWGPPPPIASNAPTFTPTTAMPTAFPSNAPTRAPTPMPTTATPTAFPSNASTKPTAFPSNAPIKAPTSTPTTAMPTAFPSMPPTGSGQTCCRAINPTVTDAWCATLGLSCSAYPDHCQIQPCR